MTKQEEIREGLEGKINRFDTFREEYSYRGFADEILNYLHSRGVVIKVDKGIGGRWLSPNEIKGYELCQQDMLVEPLIEGK